MNATPKADYLPFAAFDEFGMPADDRVQDYVERRLADERSEASARIAALVEAAMVFDLLSNPMAQALWDGVDGAEEAVVRLPVQKLRALSEALKGFDNG